MSISLQNFSTPEAGKDYIIFTSNTPQAEVISRAGMWHRDLKLLEGGYTHQDGTVVVERRYLISWDTWERYVEGTDLVEDQESVLLLGTMDSCSRRECLLLHFDWKPDLWLGRFTEVTKELALKQQGWTHNLSSGKYYTALEAPVSERWKGLVT